MRYDPERITFFAETDARGKRVPFGIKAKDRQRHMYVIGKTGMGKSTMLENMAVQDIKNGEGMAFIDPHGSSAETLLNYVPEERINDVVYFAPFDMSNPIAFNVMEDVGPEKRHLVASGLMSTFKKIWVDAWSARMEYILTNTLLALLEYPDSTLLSVNRMLSDKNYRQLVVNNISDPAVRAFWLEEFAGYTDRFAAEALPAIQNKVGQFTGNPLIRNVIGQPKSSFDIREMMDNQKILIMNLSKGLIGETNASLLGSMLTTRIYLAAMSRADLPVERMREMPNFYFYVDEFQSFANSTFADILSEARKYHLNLIVAHQYIEQMEEEVRDAVFGNVGTTIAFRVGPFDAEVLETVFTPTFLAADLVNLGFAQVYLTLMIDGIGSQPFSAVTLPPIALSKTSYRNVVIEASRKQYTTKRAVVEKIIDELHAPTPAPPKQQHDSSGKKPNGGSPSRTGNSQNTPHRAGAGNKPIAEKGNHFQNAVGGQHDRTAPVEAPRNNRTEKQYQNNRSETRPAAHKNNGKPQKEQTLGDLRSVLQQMTGGADKNAGKEDRDHKQNKRKEGGVTKNEDPNGLKAALGGILKNMEESNSGGAKTTSTPQKTEVKEPERTPVDTATPRTSAPKQEPKAKQEESRQFEKEKQPAASREHSVVERVVPRDEPLPLRDDPVSPKELERMMRITTNDKTPFR